MTYRGIDALVAESGITPPLAAINEDGEDVIIERGVDFYRLTTMQKNNWLRINTYYADGTADETYSR